MPKFLLCIPKGTEEDVRFAGFPYNFLSVKSKGANLA